MSGLVSGFVSVRLAHPADMDDWLEVPVGRDAARWATAATERTVLAVVHTVAGVTQLLDAVELLECDRRVQIVFVRAPDVLNGGTAEFLRGLGAVVVPWQQATRSRFDLALVTDSAGAHRLDAPVLSLPHGVMNNKVWPPGLVVGLSAPWLTWYGRVVPATVALSHVDLLAVLADQCPPAVPAARVVGDLCLDRLAVSRRHRTRYRSALGVPPGRGLVAVCSTWGRESMFGRPGALLPDLVSGLVRDRYAVVAGLHPAAWFGHGPRQVMAWLREPRRLGLGLVDPIGWRGLLAAADVVVGDHGSATIYAAAAGVPVLHVPGAAEAAGPGSALAALAACAPALDAERSLPVQFGHAVAMSAGVRDAVAARVSSEPGRAARLLRTEMYRLLGLDEPAWTAETAPVAAARLVGE